MRCWREGKWQTDELANLASKLELELKAMEATLRVVMDERDRAMGEEARLIKEVEFWKKDRDDQIMFQ